MVTYKYTGITKDGTKVDGVVKGFNELDAIDRVKDNCDIVTKITEVKENGASNLLTMEIGGNRLDTKAFTVMCSQFAIILKAGIPVARTVQLIADKTTDKPLKKMLKEVAEDVEAGRTLAASFSDRGSKLLPVTFIETIRAGEESGNVEKAFDTMYRHFDKQSKMAGKVKSALSYPAFVLVIAVVVVIVLMVKVVPTFTSIFDSYGAELPAITRLLIAISDFFANYWWVMVIVGLVIALSYKFYQKTEDGRINLAKWSLKVPVLGEIGLLNAASQFANNLTTLLGAGLTITKAITITSRVLDNYYISNEIGKMTGKLEEGKMLGTCMRESGCLPAILVDMVGVGEETGELEDTLHTIAEYYDAELEMAITNALNKLEPTVLVLIAGIGGFIVIAIYMAMFEMYGVM